MICKNCGVLLGEGHVKCPRCGALLVNKEDETAAARHADSPWKRPERRVSTLPSDLKKPERRTAQAPAERKTPVEPDAGEEEPRRERTARSASRPASSPPPAAPEKPVRHAAESTAASRPDRRDEPVPSTGENAKGSGENGGVRMVRRHRYKAIEPEHSDFASLNWIRLLAVTAVAVAALAFGIHFFLTKTTPGTLFCARMGFNTTAEAYHALGREYMSGGSISRAVRALEIAQTKEPDDLETLIDLGRAYTATNQSERAELAYAHAIECWPNYPESYRYLIDLMTEDGRNYEALQCIALAIERTGDSYFTTLQRELRPATPAVSVLGGSFDKEFELTMSADEGAKIYYVINSKSTPMEEGILYTETVYLEEGTWKIQIVAAKDGMFSNVNSQTYIVNKPNPDAPKANLQPGTYDRVRQVSLRASKDVVAIYYTIDGTAPTTESKLYEGPIQLRVGKTTLRAIAVNSEGKVSNEMVEEYVCQGKAGTAFKETDRIDKLELNGTTKEKFISTYGDPSSETDDGYDDLGTYTRLHYAWGSAVFLDKQNGKSPVLVELVTSSPDMKGPRSTGVGMRVEDVLSAFRDAGGEENANGVRNLYTLRTTDTGALGILTREDEGKYHIGYYYHLTIGAWLELSYYSEGGLITRMEWMWYMSQ